MQLDEDSYGASPFAARPFGAAPRAAHSYGHSFGSGSASRRVSEYPPSTLRVPSEYAPSIEVPIGRRLSSRPRECIGPHSSSLFPMSW